MESPKSAGFRLIGDDELEKNDMLMQSEKIGAQHNDKAELSTAMDKVSFIFNNLTAPSIFNAVDTVTMLIEDFGDTFRTAFSQYLVTKRVTLDSNLHALYFLFLEELNDGMINALIKEKTLEIIKNLLKEKGDPKSHNRTRQCLKDLGHWLGVITIARNQPIPVDELDLRALLVESFHEGQDQLLFIVPFVTKILASSGESLFFGPKSAWINSILLLLTEIYYTANLKTQIDFEIEFLFTDLHMSLLDMWKVLDANPDRRKLPLEVALEPEEKEFEKLSKSPSTMRDVLIDYTDIDLYQPLSVHLHKFVNFPPNLEVDPSLKRVICDTLHHFLKDYIQKVVSSSTPTAVSLTSRIIAKDFSTCSNPVTMRQCFILMVRTMAMSMAFSQARLDLPAEVKQVMLYTYLQYKESRREIMSHPNFGDDVDQIVALCVDLAARYITKAAGERAMLEADLNFMKLLQFMRVQPKNEIPEDVRAVIDAMPDEIKLPYRALTDEEIRVYELFAGADNTHNTTPIETLYLEFMKPRHSPVQMIVKHPGQLAIELQHVNNTAILPMIQDIITYCSKVPALTGLQLFSTIIIHFVQNPDPMHIPVIIDSLVDYFIQYTDDPNPIPPLQTCFLKIVGCIQKHVDQDVFFQIANRVVIDHIEQRNIRAHVLAFLLYYEVVHNGIIDQYFCRCYERVKPFLRQLISFLQLKKSEKPPPDCDSLWHFQAVLPLTYREVYLEAEVERALIMQPFDETFKSSVRSILYDWKMLCKYDAYMNHFRNKLVPMVVDMLTEVRSNDNQSINAISKLLKKVLDMVMYVVNSLLAFAHLPEYKQRYRWAVDTFPRLVCVLIKNCDQIADTDKPALLCMVLRAVVRKLKDDHDQPDAEFNGLPYQRIIFAMFLELCAPESLNKWNFVGCFFDLLYDLQPYAVPGFAHQWLDILGHKDVVALCLGNPEALTNMRASYSRLLAAHLKYMAPNYSFLGKSASFTSLYKATLRLMCLLFQTCPSLIYDYCEVLCDIVPHNCIQLRNLILSACPTNLRMPDPFEVSYTEIQNFSMMSRLSPVATEMFQLIPKDLKSQLVRYLVKRENAGFPNGLSNAIKKDQKNVVNDTDIEYKLVLLNALVLYVGSMGTASLVTEKMEISAANIADTAHMDVFDHFLTSLCTQGRYFLLNAIFNQLRYPSAQTNYFACLVLHLFDKYPVDIKEQITRCFFERLVCRKPHPWGLLLALVELMSNKTYNFWSYDFVNCIKEVQELFVRLARCCKISILEFDLEQPNAICAMEEDAHSVTTAVENE